MSGGIRNIFTDVNEFIGGIQPLNLAGHIARFIDAATAINEMLGDNHALLTEYLEIVLDVIAKTNIETAATIGFSYCGNELRDVCGGVIRGDDKNSQHPFYQTAKRYMDSHPLQYKDEQCKLEFYTVALIGLFEKCAAEKYYKEFRDKLEGDDHIARVSLLYNEICSILGTEGPMENLNSIIKKGFITVPTMASFTQGIIDCAILSLLYQEPETKKFVFEMPMGIEC